MAFHAMSEWVTHRRISAKSLFEFAGRCIPWLAAGAGLFCAAGLAMGLMVVPADMQHGELHRVLFVYLPAAWVSLLIGIVLTLLAAIVLASANRHAFRLIDSLAPTGAMFALLALWSGSLFSKHAWGTWWVWDIRFTSEAILLLAYSGMVAVRTLLEEDSLADRLIVALACAGVAVLALGYVSMRWWPLLDEGHPVRIAGPQGVDGATLLSLFFTALGMCFYASAAALSRMRCVILEAERHDLCMRNIGDTHR